MLSSGAGRAARCGSARGGGAGGCRSRLRPGRRGRRGRHGLWHRERAPGGPHRRPGQRLRRRGQAPGGGCGRHRCAGRAERDPRRRRRLRESGGRGPRDARPGRARSGSLLCDARRGPSACRGRGRRGGARCGHGSAKGDRHRLSASSWRRAQRGLAGGGLALRLGVRARAPAHRHLRAPGASVPRAQLRHRLPRRARLRGLRRLHDGCQPRAPHGRAGARVLGAVRARLLPVDHLPARAPRRPPHDSPRTWGPWPTARGSSLTQRPRGPGGIHDSHPAVLQGHLALLAASRPVQRGPERQHQPLRGAAYRRVRPPRHRQLQHQPLPGQLRAGSQAGPLRLHGLRAFLDHHRLWLGRSDRLCPARLPRAGGAHCRDRIPPSR